MGCGVPATGPGFRPVVEIDDPAHRGLLQTSAELDGLPDLKWKWITRLMGDCYKVSCEDLCCGLRSGDR
jgi:hypothetical protein